MLFLLSPLSMQKACCRKPSPGRWLANGPRIGSRDIPRVSITTDDQAQIRRPGRIAPDSTKYRMEEKTLDLGLLGGP